ncbi:MAG: hypothetical protein WAW88_03120 [Nocardioides sp.]
MNRLSGVVLAACLTAGTLLFASLTPAHAAGGVDPVAGVEAHDISTADYASFFFLPGWKEIEISRSDAFATEMAPFEPYPVDSSVPSTPTIAAGEVVCLRMRAEGSEDPWKTVCTARGRSYRSYRIIGGSRVFSQSADLSYYRSAVSLLRGARIAVPGLRPGMHVGTVEGYPSARPWRHYGESVWVNPDGAVARVGLFGGQGFRGHVHAVSTSGTGHIAGQRQSNSIPISEIVVFPEWFPFASDTVAATSLLDYEGGADHTMPFHPQLRPDRYNGFNLNTIAPIGYQVELSTRVGSSLKKAPPWRSSRIPRYSSRLMVPLRAGWTACVRLRLITPAGTPTSWRPTMCASRPFDDRIATRKGRTKRVDDPYFADGRATRMSPGSRLILRKRVLKHSRVGTAWVTEGDWGFYPELRNCRAHRAGGADPDDAALPSYVSERTRKACRPVLVYDATYPKRRTVNAIIVVPPWAAEQRVS